MVFVLSCYDIYQVCVCVCVLFIIMTFSIFFFCFFFSVHDPFKYITFYGLRNHGELLGKLVR